ncbi:MAG TPA: hypothetical protein VH143_22465 [Kofleriaceae bacterium]|jgi:hypothetical protein|nr:hypothetical protein [Kofleriaceae bacterium]
MRAVKSFVVVTMLVLLGCKKDEPAPAPNPPANGSGSGSSAMVAIGSGSADVGSGSGSAAVAVETAGSGELQDVGSAVDPTAMSHHAQHCPSMVRGAVTTAKLDGKSVVVTITSDDQKAASKIQTRADKLLADKATAKLAGDLPTPAHAQNGTHGGGIGICPVHVPEGATAKRTTIANGVSVKITPKSGVEALEKDVEARIARAADWLKANPMGDGDGDGDGGGNGGGNGSGNAHHGHRHS